MMEAIISHLKNSIEKVKSNNIEILLVDDHRMFRVVLRKIIEEYDDLTIVGEASDGMEAIKLARENRPDVITMDINMPGMNGIEATRIIKADFPNTRIIGLSMNDEYIVREDMKNAGAAAYLNKTEVSESLIEAIREEELVK